VESKSSKKNPILIVLVLIMGFAAAWLIGMRFLVGSLPVASVAPRVELTNNAKLRLISARAEGSSNYSDVIGEVENISGETLDHISAVITWRDEAGTFIVAERSVLDVSPLLPGQRSTWDVTTRNRPGMKRYSVSFQRGQQIISHIDK
jgi:hypothetical protein